MQLETGYTKDLDISLSDEEVADRGERLARAVAERKTVEEEKAKATRAFAERLKAIDLRVLQLTNAVNDRKEARPVLVSDRADLRRLLIETYRHDTGAVIDSRPMTQDELEEARQMNIFGPGVGVRVATEQRPPLAVVAPPPAETAAGEDTDGGPTVSEAEGEAETASDAAAGDDETAVTDPEGLLNGKAAKPKRKRARKADAKGDGMKLASAEDIARTLDADEAEDAESGEGAPAADGESGEPEAEIDEDDLEPASDEPADDDA